MTLSPSKLNLKKLAQKLLLSNYYLKSKIAVTKVTAIFLSHGSIFSAKNRLYIKNILLFKKLLTLGYKGAINKHIETFFKYNNFSEVQTMKLWDKNKKEKIALESDKKIPFWPIIFGYAKGQYGRFTIAVICSLFTGIMVAVQPLIIKYVVDNGITNTEASADLRLKIAGFFCALYILVSLLRVTFWATGYKQAVKSLESVIFNIRSKFFYHVEHLCMRFHEKISAGEIYNYLMGTPITNVRDYLMQVLMSIPYQIIAFIISAVALFTYDWLLTIVMLAVCFIMIAFWAFARKKVRRLSYNYIQKESQASKYLTDVLHGMDAVKMYSVEENIYKTFTDYASTIREEGAKLNYARYAANIKPEMMTFIGTAVIYFIGAFSCIYRGVSTGTLFAFITSMGTIFSTLVSWLSIGLVRQSAESGLKKIMDVLNVQSTTPEVDENKQRLTEVEKSSAQRKNKSCIEFENVGFAYDTGETLFKDLSCNIGYCESIGLVGSSGSGKSTFTKLVMRLYDVQAGAVKIHGKNIKDYKIHDLRRTFGVVPQNPFIFQGTIMDNIRIARPDCENIEIIKAMEIAHVHEFVNDLPKGWNTVVGDGGINLSGGQKQRIAIARAVLGNPDILIFDEATSALDNVSERHIQEAMETLMQSHTVIIVAHRLSTIKNVDRIMVFEKGNIVEEGTYTELAEKDGGVFSNLLNNQ